MADSNFNTPVKITDTGGTMIGYQESSPTETIPIQLLQRGFIIGASDGGPIDVSEIVEGITSNINQNLTKLFKKMGNLFYGKKVYIKEKGEYYFYSKDDSWKTIE